MSSNDKLHDAIVFGERDVVVEMVQEAVDNGEDVVNLLNETMIPALREVGDQFSSGEIFVPEMLVSARAMQAGVDIIEPLLVESGHGPVVEHFKGREDVKVVVGGAVISQEYADQIGADGFGVDASDAVRAVRECLGICEA